MSHPDLDEQITVPASAVPFHAAAGWVRVEEPPKQDQAAGDAPGGEKSMSERPRASTKRKGED